MTSLVSKFSGHYLSYNGCQAKLKITSKQKLPLCAYTNENSVNGN